MILRRYMSLLGIGSAKIDLILEKETYKPGEKVEGYFLIRGGTVEQQLKGINCDLVVTDHEEKTETSVDTVTIFTSTRIHSEELNKVSFTFRLPETLKASASHLSYRFKTKLTFNEGVESYDLDMIRIIE
ncbi:sporulation-control protein [Bacillus ectoiniformans]|uniref:sporulation protein n=1 Tax=Bacillus ectoiniformans TaxID=1494429 RepID=UPI00195B6983|nr:sporulation protein [Bacillus ectoiniformans]MBM7647421.1 sporulation-control protein [Bacillus ectoiniformans]